MCILLFAYHFFLSQLLAVLIRVYLSHTIISLYLRFKVLITPTTVINSHLKPFELWFLLLVPRIQSPLEVTTVLDDGYGGERICCGH
jgi:hypothetical protein